MLERGFFDRDVTEVAVDLLGRVLRRETEDGVVSARLTEVEAYAGAADPASHSYRGQTLRNTVMFGEPGHAYVYFTYGMHFCVNLVCGPAGKPSAVLLRAGQIVEGIELAEKRRGGASFRDLARGPARLCQALAIGRADNGLDVCTPGELTISGGEPVPPTRIASGPRVGVSSAHDTPWRFWIKDEPSVSSYRRHAPRVKRLPLVRPDRAPWWRTGFEDRTNVTHIVDELQWRGLLAQTTDEESLRAVLSAGPVTYYCGFDPTAPSLHVGNLVQILTMRRLQLAGHKPLALVGGATGLIGDPSGRSAERQLNSTEVVAGWVKRIQEQVSRFLSFEGDNAVRMVNNLDWTGPMSVIDFLRDIGKHFPVNKMLAREVVASRLETGLSYTEFSYQLLQGMDFLELHRRYGCVLQSGGSDQWGNLTAGADLIRRVTGNHVHVISTPLLTKPDGTKYGKTAGGAIWLDPELTSPYAFFQYWINVEDGEVGKLLRTFSFRSREEIEELEKQSAERPAARIGQRALATELTTLVHGADECANVIAASAALFGQGGLDALDERTLASALAEAPQAKVPSGELPSVADLLVSSGLCKSKSEARRTIAQGGAYVNNVKVESEEAVPASSDLLHGRFLVLRRGKRNIGSVVVG